MNFKFTISRKISLGFGLFILVVAVVLFITTRTLTESIALTRDINERHSPALYHLNILKNNVSESVALAENWVLYQTRSDNPSKLKLEKLVNEDIPKKTIDLSAFTSDWGLEDRLILEEITEEIQTLTLVYEEIKRILPSFESYSPINMMNAEFLIEDENKVDTISKQLYEFIGMLIDRQQKIISVKSKLMAESFSRLLTELIIIFIFVLFSGVIIAHFTIRSIVKPVKFLKRILLYLGKGIFPTTTMNISNDEIGDMSFAVNRLVEGLKRTTEFANEVGAGNFDAKYEPLSEDDELGRELLKMRDDLAENEKYLELKVQERTDEVVRQKEEIENQKEKVTELYKDLTDSINYAKRLQEAILPGDEAITNCFPESFVLYRPKAIVSGDFYWFKEQKNEVMFSVVDCTGHGVPGAFMSLVGYNAINQVVKTKTNPSEILKEVSKLATETLQSRDTGEMKVQDGMDMAFCTINPATLMLEYSGAFNPAYIVRGAELIELRPDKIAIGAYSEDVTAFSDIHFKLQANDIIYLFSDGYADQFGGPDGKKFMRKKFKALLLEIRELPMLVQRKELYSRLVEWQGRESQVDDICVFGIKITADSMQN